MAKLKVGPLARNDIRKTVEEIKFILGIAERPYIDIVRLVESVLPEIDQDFSVEIAAVDEIQEMAIMVPEENRMIIREDTYLNAVKGIGRDRFTIAHELGHYFLHRDPNLKFARVSDSYKLKAYEDPEWQADAFAGELLMPMWFINQTDDPKIVSEVCGVSMQAARCQLKKK